MIAADELASASPVDLRRPGLLMRSVISGPEPGIERSTKADLSSLAATELPPEAQISAVPPPDIGFGLAQLLS